MAQYKTQPGQSPAMIARALGTSVSALLSANPHKPTTVVAGRRTWQGLRYGEHLNVPFGIGMLGAVTPADPSAPHALIKQGSRGADVALWQTIIGTAADGVFGPNTAAATKVWQRAHGVSPDGVVGPNTWTAALGGLKAPVVTTVVAPAPTSAALPQYTPGSRTISQGSRGSDVAAWQTAIGASSDGIFGPATKAATVVWQKAHGLSADGVVGPNTWAAALGAAAPKTVQQAAVQANQTQQAAQAEKVAQQVNAGGSSGPAQGVTVAAVPAAVQALVGINPCLETNSGKVYAAQTALGIKADGKYGPGTSAAARALGINAPAACSPAPMWWGVKGTAQATAATQTAAAAAPTAVAAHPIVTAAATTAAAVAQATEAVAKSAQASTQTQADDAATTAQAAKDAAARAAAAATTQAQADAAESARKLAQAALDAAAEKGGTASTAITPEKKISTGAIVAGAVGAAALVGLIAYAVTKKPGARGKRGKPGKRGPAKRRVTKRKPAKRSKRK